MERINRNLNTLFFDEKLFLPNSVLQLWVKEQARLKNVDPISFVAHMLPTIGHLMSGCKTEVEFHPTWTEYPILYDVLVASKSTAKSPVMHLITKEVSAIAKEERELALDIFNQIEEDDDEDNGGAEKKKFNSLAFVRLFDAATAQGIQHTLAAGSGNILGSVDEMAGWCGITDPLLESNLLKCFSALPWNDLTVKHQDVIVEKPIINLVCNIQTPIIVEMLKKKDYQGKWGRYSLWASRPQYCKRFNIKDQLKPLHKDLKDFSLKKIYKRIVDFHEASHVQYRFNDESDELAQEIIEQLNGMGAGTDDVDFESLLTKCVAKLLRISMIQCALRKAVDEDVSGISMVNGVVQVEILADDVQRARRCVLYTIASYMTLRDKDVDDMDQALQADSFIEDQPQLPRARKYRKKMEAIPQIETSTTSDLTTPKISKILLKWYKGIDENSRITRAKIMSNRWFIRDVSYTDDAQVKKLIGLFSHHGLIHVDESSLTFVRDSNSSLVAAKLQILKEEIPGYLM